MWHSVWAGEGWGGGVKRVNSWIQGSSWAPLGQVSRCSKVHHQVVLPTVVVDVALGLGR